MARRKNQYHARFAFLGPLKGAKDEFMGAGLGVAGALAAKWLLKQPFMSFTSSLPDPLLKLAPVLGSAAAGLGAYYAQKKSASAKAHFATAVAAGAALTAWDWLRAEYPEQFSDTVSLKLNGYSYGLPINDPRPPFHGLIVNDSNRNLAQLAAMSMGVGDDVGGTSLVDYDYDY